MTKPRLVGQLAVGLCVVILMSCGRPPETSGAADWEAEAIVVGAGLSGLAAAVEMGRADLRVLVLDMNSVMGGHAVMAGGFAIVDTPLQDRLGIEDSAESAYSDWMKWTEQGDPDWTRYYAERSGEMIFTWLAQFGVEFVRVQAGHENSVPRFHFTAEGALDVVVALYRAALALPSITFEWNENVDSLVVDDGAVTGVVVRNLRSGSTRTLRAPHVVLATGGFEGDLDRVLENWRPDLPQPDRLLVGASVHATGQGHDLAAAAGAALVDMDRHYIYTNGIEDPRDTAGRLAITAGNDNALWLNDQGRRFTNESGFDKTILADLLDQTPSSYWAIFDQSSRARFGTRGREWVNNTSDRHLLLDDDSITHKADSLEELASLTGLPPETMLSSIRQFNASIEMGFDRDFHRFESAADAPPKIERPPFYALRFHPMTRKSMGGVDIDMQARALDRSGAPIPGLYAVGELTGSVGINGIHGMDGMFLGPALVTGRIAGQTIIASRQMPGRDDRSIKPAPPEQPMPSTDSSQPALTADDLRSMLATPRDGYWHFEVSHALALEREYDCSMCHSAEMPFQPIRNRTSKREQSRVCTTCHGR